MVINGEYASLDGAWWNMQVVFIGMFGESLVEYLAWFVLFLQEGFFSCSFMIALQA